MSSPLYTIDGRQDGKIMESRTTSNRAMAETMAESYRDKYGYALISKLARVEQSVAVYEPMKEYKV